MSTKPNTSSHAINGNPRKRRRLNNNAVAATHAHKAKGKSEQQKQSELSRAHFAGKKPDTLKEINKIKAECLAQMQTKSKEITDLQQKLQILYHESEQRKQEQTTWTHKVEIFESEIDKLQKENFKLRAQVYQKKSASNDSQSRVSNGNTTTTTTADVTAEMQNYELKCVDLEKQVQIKDVTINAQNEEIMRLQTQIEKTRHNNNNSENNSDSSLTSANKHIQRLQQQLNQHKTAQSNLAQSETEALRESYDRKIRLLQSALHEHKTECQNLRARADEYELCQQSYDTLKQKYNALQALNIQYEPIAAQFNEWKNILREMCVALDIADSVSVLQNEFDLKLALQQMHAKFVALIRDRDEHRSNFMKCNESYQQCEQDLSALRVRLQHECEARQTAAQKHATMQTQLTAAQNDAQSYKNVFATYNALSPCKNSQQQQISKLYAENERLSADKTALQQQVKDQEHAHSSLLKRLERSETENAKLHSRVGSGDFNAADTQILTLKTNPLRMAMQRQRSTQGERISELESTVSELQTRLRTAQQQQSQQMQSMEERSTSGGGSGSDGGGMDLVANVKYFELENKYNILIKKLELKNEEISTTKQEMQSAKKIGERMKALFGKKAGEFRERIYQMTGYNVSLLQDAKHYRLQHMWMSEESDEIILQIDKLGQLQLKDTEFVRNLHKTDKSLIQRLQSTRSLPLFLSELTLFLYKID